MLSFYNDFIWLVVECKITKNADSDSQLCLGLIAAAIYNFKRFDIKTIDLVGLKVSAGICFFYDVRITKDYVEWLKKEKSVKDIKPDILQVNKFPYEGLSLKLADDRILVSNVLNKYMQSYETLVGGFPKKVANKK